MAVTLTLDQIRARVDPLGDEFLPTEYNPVELWFNVARAAVVKYAPSAPDESHNLACMMMVDYWDGIPDPPHIIRQADGGGKDTWTSAQRSGNSLRYSGAMALLSPWKVRRAI